MWLSPGRHCILGACRAVGSEINYAFSSWVSRPHMSKQEPGLDLLEWAAISQTASPSSSLP